MTSPAREVIAEAVRSTWLGTRSEYDAADDIEALVAKLVHAERRRIIALAREYGTESTTALADQLAQEEP